MSLHIRNFCLKDRENSTLLGPLDVDLAPGEKVGIIGESGSGKSLLLYALLGALPPGIRIASGDIHLLGCSPESARRERFLGSRIGWVPQDPGLALHPMLTVRDCLTLLPSGRRKDVPEDLLTALGLPMDGAFLRRTSTTLSGGEKQRLAWVLALSGAPEVLILDEPTAHVEPELLPRLERLLRERFWHVAWLWVAHDLPTVAQFTERLLVLYGGHLLEAGPTESLLQRPTHPYTQRLLEAASGIPRLDPGFLQGPRDRAPGCPFSPRCPSACGDLPPWRGSTHAGVRCFSASEGQG